MTDDLLNSEEAKRLRAAGTLLRQAWEKRHSATEAQKALIRDALSKARTSEGNSDTDDQGKENQRSESKTRRNRDRSNQQSR